MAQIVIRKQIPKYCNLSAIQQGGTKADIVLDKGEIWLVDTTNSEKPNGTGLYNAFIKGDKITPAKNLTLNKLGGSGMSYEDTGVAIESAVVKRTLAYPVPSADDDKIPTTQAVGAAIQSARDLITQEIQDAVAEVAQDIPDISGKANAADVYTKTQVDTALGDKQDSISSVTVAVDDNIGTPTGSVTFDNNNLAFSFQNLKGAKGEKGDQGIQGIQGPRGAEGAAGITGDVSDLSIRQAVDATTTYTDTDVAGAEALQYILTHDIEGGFYHV